jgi:hypothetical protein
VDPEAAFAPIDEESTRLGWTPELSSQCSMEIDGQVHKIVYTSSEHYEKGKINRVRKARGTSVWNFAKGSHGRISQYMEEDWKSW